MANNILNLSDLNNELPVFPDVVYIQNNSKSNSIRYDNCQFNLKSKGKKSVCLYACYASVSLEVKDDTIVEPFHIINTNSKHKIVSCTKPEDWFSVKTFYQDAKRAVEENASLPIQQVYFLFRKY